MAPVQLSSPKRVKRNRRVVKQKRPKAPKLECGICLDGNCRKKFVTCSCPGKHVFHKTCMIRWMKTFKKKKKDPTCPICRHEIFDFYDPLRERVMKQWNCKNNRLIHLDNLPKRFEDDAQVLLPLIVKNPNLFENVSHRLKNDYVFIYNLITNSHLFPGKSFVIFKDCGHNIRNDQDITSQVISDSFKSAFYMGNDLKKNKTFMLETIKNNSDIYYKDLVRIYKSFDNSLQNDKDVIFICLGFTTKIYSALSNELKLEPGIYNRSIDSYILEYDCMNNTNSHPHYDYRIYPHLPTEVLILESTIKKIVEKDQLAIQYIPGFWNRVKQKQFIEAILRNPFSLQFITSETYGPNFYEQMCMEAVTKDGLAIQIIHDDKFVTDEIALKACEQNGSALLHVTAKQRKNSSIVLAAINSCSDAFYFCDLKNDKNIVDFALSKSMRLLHRVSSSLRKDYIFMNSILKKYGTKENVLDFISNIDPKLISQVMNECVLLNGMALEYGSEDQQKNYELCRMAFEENKEAVRFMSNDIIDKFICMQK